MTENGWDSGLMFQCEKFLLGQNGGNSRFNIKHKVRLYRKCGNGKWNDSTFPVDNVAC